MKLKHILQNLEKNKVITRKPKPIYVFLLAIITFIIWYLIPISDQLPKNYALILTIFTFIFAIIHWIVVITLES